jgi:uncharacterized lipoprotein YmbA
MTLRCARRFRGIGRVAAALSGAGLCVSCGHSAPTEYLTLRPVPPAAGVVPAVADPVRVVAVRVPPWLDRLEVARPTPGAAVVVEDFERWSAPLGELATAALTEDLAARLVGVSVLPVRAAAPAATRDVSVDLSSLTRDGAMLELHGTVTVTDARTGALILSLPVHLRAPAAADARGEASALDQLMGELADVLAPALRTATAASR